MNVDHVVESPKTVWWDGHEYKFRPLTDGYKGEYCAWLKSKAMKEIYDMKASYGDDLTTWDNDRKGVRDGIFSLKFDWAGEICMQSLPTPSGIIKLLSICCVTTKDIEEISAFVFCKLQQAQESGIDADQSDVVRLVFDLVGEAAPKSREAWIARKRQAN